MTVTRAAAVVVFAALLVAVPGVGLGLPGGSPGAAGESPGTALSGALGAHAAELEGAVETRALDVSLVRAGTDDRRAVVLDTTVSEIRSRLEAIEHRRQELRAQRADGTITEREFRVRMRALDAREGALARLLNRSATNTDRLAPELRERYDLPRTIDAVRANFTFDGGEFGARAIDGELRLANASVEMSTSRLAYAEERYQESGESDDEVRTALACAREEIDAARTALDVARQAARDGDVEEAREHLADVDSHLADARECLERAHAAMSDDSGTSDSDSDGDWSYDESDYDKSSYNDSTEDWNKSTYDGTTS